MKVYLAGPMRGQPLHGFAAFFSAALRLRERGYDVVNPAEKDMANGFDPSKTEAEQGTDIAAVLRADFQMILDCDGIVLLPGWKNSIGARIEHAIAHYAGLRIFELDRPGRSPGLLNLWPVKLEPRVDFVGEQTGLQLVNTRRLWESLPGVKSIRLTLTKLGATDATVRVDIVDASEPDGEVLYTFGEVELLDRDAHRVQIKLDAEVELEGEAA